MSFYCGMGDKCWEMNFVNNSLRANCKFICHHLSSICTVVLNCLKHGQKPAACHGLFNAVYTNRQKKKICNDLVKKGLRQKGFVFKISKNHLPKKPRKSKVFGANTKTASSCNPVQYALIFIGFLPSGRNWRQGIKKVPETCVAPALFEFLGFWVRESKN